MKHDAFIFQITLLYVKHLLCLLTLFDANFIFQTQLRVTKAGNEFVGAPLIQPNFERDIQQNLLDTEGNNDEVSTKEAATHALRNMYDRLLPRWKGVVWTAEAELEIMKQRLENRGTGKKLPWANIKFSRGRNGNQGVDFKKFESVGINALGEYMSLPTLAKYKYHIDIGGGGGTSWTGTIQKLALPGLLFHHETPTKDYIGEL